ncbi:hypothetical protein CAEBREN_14253 [Caenorhabditis brenneri]|uniref:Uncharacterized protein n=1 Tax=Caenorhabditis brenneri TaxID=135651 RepID=G0MH02_CAEBE|nr:hypothetical protein CAEBREN_14253 [Caenorhabditis brenneri]
MWISFKVISTEDLYRDTNQEICREFYLPVMTLEGFEENVRRVSGSFKPLIIVGGFFYLHQENLAAMEHRSFLIHDGPQSLICSHVENNENGFAKAVEAIHHELNLN